MSLLEVMVALAILATGMLAMLMMNISALRSGRQGRDVTEASRVAQQQMEFLQGEPWASLAPTSWTAPVSVTAKTTGGSGVGQSFNVRYRVVADTDTNLRHIDVEVSWTEATDRAAQPPHIYAISTERHDDPTSP